MRKSAALSGCDISYFVEGEGPPLVCLHPASGVRMTPALEQLMSSSTIYQPVCPGFDGTDEPSGPLNVPRLAAWIGEFVDSVLATRVDLSGHSFGGWVGTWLAVLRPDIVGSLVLQCPIGFGPLHVPDREASAAALLARTYAHPERRRPETKADSVTARNRQLATMYGGGVVSDAGLIGRLGEVQARTLILHGRKDGVVPVQGMHLLAEAIPHSRLVLVEDAAHNIEVDQPDEFARLVREFLAAP